MRPWGVFGPLALTAAALRRRAAGKSPLDWWTAEALEQATAWPVALHHVARFAGDDPVLDVGCSVGGDLAALAAVAPAVGLDLDLARLLLARANTGSPVVQGDALDLDPRGLVFCDPARRSGGRRGFDPASWSPPLSTVLGWSCRGLGVKVAPGIEHDALPDDVEVELVSLDGDVKEALLWRGSLRSGAHRSATLLPSGDTLVGHDAPVPSVAAPGAFLLEPDGAVIRAHLVAEVCALVDGWLLDSTIAYVSAAAPVPTPFGRWYAVDEVIPFSLKGVQQAVRARDVGTLVVKKRGTAVEPEQLRRRLKLTGSTELTVVLTRSAGSQVALLCHPL